MKYILQLLFYILFSIEVFSAQELRPYLTFEEVDTSQSITVNFITEGRHKVSRVYYDTESQAGFSQNYRYQVEGRQGRIASIDKTFHHVKLDHLTPNQEYYFVIGDSELGFSKEYKFKTLTNDDSPIRLVVGGDMGTNRRISEVSQFSIQEEPQVILIGGDIAYANGKTGNVKEWEDWFDQIHQVMNTPQGFLVPLIVAIGNHEVTTGIALPWSKAPFYQEVFAQNDGKTFFVRRLGSLAVLLVLDSGHLVSHGKQRGFIQQTLAEYQNWPHRLALYHAPLYPSHRAEDDFLSSAGRDNWLELFDRYHLTASFEHHDHTLKRSRILAHHQVSTKGTLYVGDGCWGKEARSADPKRWYLKRLKKRTMFGRLR